uniref:Autophagy-related protein 13 N-terminal domain-containing protein n=1 Tax=Peronospora matthiolae TaxID=2874970 RepID=A0AAV1U9G8_9STRA
MDVSSRALQGPASLSPPSHSSSLNVRPPRSTAFCAGRSKTEQVVLEFLYKAAELIVQSRVNLQAEPDWRRSSRRARFNLDIEEVPIVRDAMAAWRDDVRLPLAIDIFWEGAAGSCHKVLLERWSVTFAAEGESSSSGVSSTQDVIQQLKEVCKKISVLLRALFSFMRQLPAHRLFAQSYPSMLSYTIHAVPASDVARAFDAQYVATSGYAFIPIATPFGLLKVATVYRRDCSQYTEQQEQAAPSRILQNNFIIQDYVPGSSDLVPASAPESSWTRAVLVPSPTREAGSPAASFVPTSDAQLLRDDDVRDLPQCRSSPRSIPMSVAGSKQHYDSTGVDCKRTREVAAVCHQPAVSKPMAIPRASVEGSITTADTLNAGTGIEYGEDKSGGILLQHAHSYGGEQDGRLRGASVDPNVTAAPYGYGNVAIEREQCSVDQCSPSVAFQQRQHQLWEGTNRQDSEIRQRDPQTFAHDESTTSNSTTGYHPLSTPPRHPQSNLLQQHDSRRRRMSFNGAFVSEVARAHSPTALVGITAKAGAALCSHDGAQTVDLEMFSASPPFRANPCELFSTSPGYSNSKSRIQSGSSNMPTYITTDQFQLRLHGAKGPPSESLISAKLRGFSPDFGDCGVTTWGISPTTPDLFSLALVGAEASVVGGQPPLLHSESRDGEGANFVQGDGFSSEGLDMLLPFALGDGSMTVASDTQSGSSPNCSSRLETAAVGAFLRQLKNAPKLSRSTCAVAGERPGKLSSEGSDDIPSQASLFDDELASFRSLRDELAQAL